MATKIWLGNSTSNKGSYNVADNWLPSGVPVDGDTLVFKDSSQSMTKGYSGVIDSYTTQVLIVLSSYSGSVGSLGQPLKSSFVRTHVAGGNVFLDLQSQSNRLVFAHGGSLWLDGTVDELSIASIIAGAASPKVIYGETSTTSRTASTVRVAGGSLELKQGTLTRATLLSGATLTGRAGTIAELISMGTTNLYGADLTVLEQFAGVTNVRNDATFGQWDVWGGAIDCTMAAEALSWPSVIRMHADATIDFRNGQAVTNQAVKVFGKQSPTYDPTIQVAGTLP